MPQDKTVCGVAYRSYEDGRFEVPSAPGGPFPQWTDEKWIAKITKYWTDYSDIITKVADEFGIPPTWVIGFISIESGGNPNACAPCQATITGADGQQHQWCSFAPNCAPAGHVQCCAYGLMQVTHGNVYRLSGGKHSGQDLLGNPELAIRYGVMVFVGNIKSTGDVLAAVKRYNGGASLCPGGGFMGMGGQVGANYVDNFVKSCNTFVSLGLAPASRATMTSNLTLVFLAFGLLGYVGYQYLDKEYRITDQIST